MIVGCIIAAGLNKISQADVQKAIQTGVMEDHAKKHITCAPAQGLLLRYVSYDKDMIDFNWVTCNLE